MVAACPLAYESPNAPKTRDVLGTIVLSVLAGHSRYAHITSTRLDRVNAGLLGMTKAVSEDAVRRGLAKIAADGGRQWIQGMLERSTRPLFGESRVLDIDISPGNESSSKHWSPRLWNFLDRLAPQVRSWNNSLRGAEGGGDADQSLAIVDELDRAGFAQWRASTAVMWTSRRRMRH